MYTAQDIEKKRQEAIERKNAAMQARQKGTGSDNQTIKRSSTSPIASTPSKQFKPSTNGNVNLTAMFEKQYAASVPPGLNGSHSSGNKSKAYRSYQSRTSASKSQSPKTFYNSNPISVNCHLISEIRFEANANKYHEPFINFCKMFSSRSYNSQSRQWSFSINEYNDFIKRIRSEVPNVKIEEIPPYVFTRFLCLMNKSSEEKTIDLSRIEPKLLESLMPFQEEGVRFGIKFRGKCIIADDMGLGKTIQALGIAHYYREDWPLLIVCPASVRYSWSEAIYDFLPSVSVQDIIQFSSDMTSFGNEKITIVSYDLLSRWVQRFQTKLFKTIIFDESHALKNWKSERTKSAKTIAANAEHVILLSGTPALSRPSELHPQLSFIIKNFIDYIAYGKRYCAAEMTRFGWNMKGSSNVNELQILLKSCGLLRRLKVDVLRELPPKMREVVLLDPSLIGKSSEEEQKLARKLSQVNNHYTLVQYYSQSSNNRLKAVVAFITDLLSSDEKFLVFAHHTKMLDAIETLAVSKKKKYVRIDGTTRDVDRQQAVENFQRYDDYQVAILSITAAGTGITLTAASFVVFAELYWNPGILAQAEDRAHRIGQNSCVFVKYLVAKGTSDDFMWPIIQAKLEFLNKAGLNQGFKLNNADFCEHKPVPIDKKQSSLDSFVVSSQPNGNELQDNINKSKEIEEDISKFYGSDDDDFDGVDLSNIP